MRTNHDRVHMILAMAAILACILLPVSAIAAQPSVKEQLSTLQFVMVKYLEFFIRGKK